MQVTIDIPDELAAEAKARGLELELFVADQLRQELRESEMSPEDRAHGVAAMREFSNAHRLTLRGNLKELIHEGHTR